MREFLRRCGWLTVITIGVWGLLVWPVYAWGGWRSVEGMSLAAVLCLLPGWLVFWLLSRYGVAHGPMIILAASGIRMTAVLGAAMYIQSVRPLPFNMFFVWLVPFYLVTLAVETFLVLPVNPFFSQERE